MQAELATMIGVAVMIASAVVTVVIFGAVILSGRNKRDGDDHE